MLIKVTTATTQQIQQLNHLIIAASKQDGYRIKVYWDMLTDVENEHISHFFYYKQQHLIGYLGLFEFTAHFELSATVRPGYRKQGIFTCLAQQAFEELTKQGQKTYQLIWPHGATSHLLHTATGAFEKTEYLMQYDQQSFVPAPTDLSMLNLRRAYLADALLVAKLHVASFDSDFKVKLDLFSSLLTRPTYQIWIACLNELNIGKVHCDIENKHQVYLEDICISPDFRRQHLGSIMLINLTMALHKQGFSQINLSVLKNNQNAISFYKYCGFKIIAGYDYWRMPVNTLK